MRLACAQNAVSMPLALAQLVSFTDTVSHLIRISYISIAIAEIVMLCYLPVTVSEYLREIVFSVLTTFSKNKLR